MRVGGKEESIVGEGEVMVEGKEMGRGGGEGGRMVEGQEEVGERGGGGEGGEMVEGKGLS